MNSEHSVLVVDSNVPFATLLKEGLEQEGRYRVVVAADGDEALQTFSAAEFSLAIVDLGLTDMDGITLAGELRQRKPDLRLMLIPLDGATLPPEAEDLDVQGVLTKPFFLPDLPGCVADALSKPLGAGIDSPPSEAPEDGAAPDEEQDQIGVERSHTRDVGQEMKALSQEVNADAVILSDGEELIAYTGRLSEEGMSELAQAVTGSWRTSAHVAQILGQEQVRFELSMGGGNYLLYSLDVVDEVVLSVASRAGVPLGIIRHRTRATADAVRVLLDRG